MGADGMAGGKKLYVKTYGCQMNVYDSERIGESLIPLGYTTTEDITDADLVVLNTCHIREKAAEKVYSELGRIRAVKQARQSRGQEMLVTVAGCVAQAEGTEIVRRAPVVDLVVGPQSYHTLPELIFKARSEQRQIVAVEFPEDDKFRHLPVRSRAASPSAFLTVQEGCDKFCTFCVVPYTRGMETSRPAAEIEAEARRLVAGGVRELTLLGQNVNAYHGAGPDGSPLSLARLIDQLSAIDGLERVRRARPDIALSSDIIVGFPGETEADFAATLSLVQAVGLAHAYSFKYSARPGTPAATMADQVPDGVKSERLARLQELIGDQQAAFNRAAVGTVLPVLFDKSGARPGTIIGRTPYLQSVQCEAPLELVGQVAEVEIASAVASRLSGILTSPHQHTSARHAII